MILDKELILTHQDAKNSTDVFNLMAKEMLNKNYVTSDFLNGILTREKNYPTGLKISDDIGVAIPHTDSKFVNEAKISVLTLNDPVEFSQMGSSSDIVKVNIVFMMAIKKPEEQLSMLQTLMQTFQDQKFLKKILDTNDNTEIINLLNSKG